MDPIERIDIRGDSTFVLMLEAQARGFEVFYAHPRALRQVGSTPWITTNAVSVQYEVGNHFQLGKVVDEPVCAFDAVFMRKDPPFDVPFLTYTWLLDRVDRARTVLVNDPQGIRDFNEKLSALRWPELMPPTLVAAERKALRQFIDEHQEVIVKPLDGAGGSGIVLLRAGDRNIGSVLDILTQEGQVHIEAQVYLPEVSQGDKRLLLLDGEPIGAVMRVPAENDVRANMHVGGRAEKTLVSERDRLIAEELSKELKSRGLLFVGIDIIGGYLTEVNVTSPTGIQEANRLDALKIESAIIDKVEQKRSLLNG